MTGLLIGVLSGLLGVGGGLVAVPALVWILARQGVHYDILMHMAVGTSLAGILFTSLAAIYKFSQQNNIVWVIVKKLVPAVMIGVLFGVYLAHRLSTQNLKIVFGLFVFIVAIHFLFERKKNQNSENKIFFSKGNYFSAGIITGLSAGLMGVGGSVIMIPYLLYKGLNMRQASGTSIACVFPLAFVAVISMTILGWGQQGLPPYSTGYINWPAALSLSIPSVFSVSLGAYLGKRLPQLFLKKIFAVFLIFVSLNMLF